MAERAGRARVFVSYAHEDDHWRRRLRVHLAPLVAEGLIELWDDRSIEVGARWELEIERQLQVADVAILLVSPDFLASEFVRQRELPALSSAAAAGKVTILPLILSHSLFSQVPALAQLQAFNLDQPLLELEPSDQDRVLVEVALRVRRLAESPRRSSLRLGPLSGENGGGPMWRGRGRPWQRSEALGG